MQHTGGLAGHGRATVRVSVPLGAGAAAPLPPAAAEVLAVEAAPEAAPLDAAPVLVAALGLAVALVEAAPVAALTDAAGAVLAPALGLALAATLGLAGAVESAVEPPPQAASSNTALRVGKSRFIVETSPRSRLSPA
jgi:hypothetical protein